MKKDMKKELFGSVLTCTATTIAIIFLLILFPGITHAKNILEVGKFSSLSPEQKLPPGWEPLVFKKIKTHTDYRLVSDNNITVVVANSRDGASGLVRKQEIDLKKYPIIRWRWKVTRTYPNGNISKKSGDDLPARIYIMFKYDSSRVGFFERAAYHAMKLFYGNYPPSDAINYVWASHMPVGTMAPNPYTSKLKFIVIESGNKKINQWIMETRNVYEDYKRAFKKEPPPVSGIAIMTDTDNTNSEALSYYGDIEMMSASPE